MTLSKPQELWYYSWNQLLFCQNSAHDISDQRSWREDGADGIGLLFFKNVSRIWDKKADDHWILQDRILQHRILQHRILITKAVGVDLYWRKEKIQGVKAISGKKFKLTFNVSIYVNSIETKISQKKALIFSFIWHPESDCSLKMVF